MNGSCSGERRTEGRVGSVDCGSGLRWYYEHRLDRQVTLKG